MNYLPGDHVTWIRVKPRAPQQAQLIPAVVSHRTQCKIVIKIKDPTGWESLRMVKPQELRHRREIQ